MNPNEIVAISLDAASWHSVMALLAEGPYKVAAPLIHSIQQQCMAYEQVQRGPREVPLDAAE